jgi:hypothetical protein
VHRKLGGWHFARPFKQWAEGLGRPHGSLNTAFTTTIILAYLSLTFQTGESQPKEQNIKARKNEVDDDERKALPVLDLDCRCTRFTQIFLIAVLITLAIMLKRNSLLFLC